MRLVILVCLLVGSAGCATGGGSAPGSLPNSLTAEQVAKASQVEVDHLLIQARLASNKDDHEAASVLYQRIVSLDDSAENWLNLALELDELQHVEPALAAYTKALEKDPELSMAHQKSGLLLLRVRRYQEAKDHFAQAVASDPELWRSWNGLGVIADLAGELDIADGHYAAAIAVNAKSSMLWNNRGYSRYLAEDFTAARQYFEFAIATEVSYKPAWANLGLVSARVGEYEEALDILSKIQPQAVAYNDIGYIALLNNDLDTSEYLIGRAIATSPSYYEAAQNNMALLNLEREKQALRDLK